ncbi:MAG TPA: FliH/SctL family protein [Candidatus Cybelea sp.]|jgi:flagellar biosynthesis/type III secretory pathway protein FliH|nr:FliH/SctL family protein [Candidatus Cybelea sp.]
MREFVPLTALLRPLQTQDKPAAPEIEIGAELDRPAVHGTHAAVEYAVTLGAIRRFRAALADALDAAVERLLREIAESVLARELGLRPADVASIVAKARERLLDERIVAVRVHPQDREALAELQVEKIADTSLRPGDIVVELRSGTIDLRLRARLEAALAAALQ